MRRGNREHHRPALDGWEGLTKTEKMVTLLVAQGMTNREVAVHLYVSPHTVNTHLRHIFQKLGVSTRMELAAPAERRVSQT